jgi:hypothetical protein
MASSGVRLPRVQANHGRRRQPATEHSSQVRGDPFGFYPWYTAAWVGYYEPPRVYERDVYVSETSLYDLRKNRLVWSGTVKTDAPRNIDTAIKQYVKTAVKALERDGVLARA